MSSALDSVCGLPIPRQQLIESIDRVSIDHAAMPLEAWTRGFVLKLRDKAFEQRKRRFANYMVAVVQGVFTWGARPRTHH
jgi:hypothetical protein